MSHLITALSQPLQRLSIFRAFRHRNYRLFFFGQFLSLTGTWITSIATSWLVFRISQSELLLGVVAFAGQFPSFLMAPLAGVLIDRWNRQQVLIVTQCASLLQSLALTILTFSGMIGVWSVCGLAIFQALVNAFDMPARQSFVKDLLDDKEDLPNAIALNSAMFNGSRLIGPAIGGVIIALSSEGACFLIDTLSYFAVILSLFRITVLHPKNSGPSLRMWEGLREGFRYIIHLAPIREALFMVAMVSLLGTPHVVLMPVFAHEVLQGGPGLLGVLMGATGLGALIGALVLAARRSTIGMGSLIAASAFMLGISLLGFSISRNIWLSALLLVLIGASTILVMASCNTILQTLVDDNKRARVMSFYLMAFMGMMPLGSLISGTLASHFSAPLTVGLGGLACIFVAIIFIRKLPALRSQARI